jgi:hypothetical protein
MAKLSNETSETIWSLKRQLAKVIENAKATEFALFDTFGENERTDSYLADSRLSKFGVLTPSLKSQMIC